MVRCLVPSRDAVGLRQVLSQLRTSGHSLDGVSRNKALAVCVGAGAMDLAELILAAGACSEEPDVVAYNTLLKGYAKAGEAQRCLALSRQMEARRVAPSAVTFGILLDAAARRKDLAAARELLKAIRQSDLAYNAVHCTSVLKGLIAAGLLDEAVEMLGEMRSRPGASPDLVAYTTVLRALGEQSRTRDGVALLRQMRQDEVLVDDVAFHSVLDGGAHGQHSGQEVLALLAELVDLGLQPSTATLSIVLKAMARSRDFDLAWTFLEGSHRRFGAQVARPRLFLQLGQACIRGGAEHRAAHVYRRFLELPGSEPELGEGAVAQQLIRACLAAGSERGALEIRSVAQQAGVHLHPWVAKSLSPTAAAATP
eukprot:SRR837773.2686.p2 GENE.SRR837773.2686~~SRR837773.2686.p2  ORF type:complete len:395 (-),score=138.88 SRR837773.2686:39-1142(-)